MTDFDTEHDVAAEAGRDTPYLVAPVRRTKIICTIGPASREPDTLESMIRAGMDVTRVRKIMQTIGFGGSAAVLAVVGYVESIPLAIALMSIGSVFGGATAGGFGVNHLDIAPRGAGVIRGTATSRR